MYRESLPTVQRVPSCPRYSTPSGVDNTTMRHRVVPPSWVFGCLSVWRRVQVMPGHPLPFIKVADFGLSKHDASLTFTRVVSNGITCTAVQLPLSCQQALRRHTQITSGSTAAVPSLEIVRLCLLSHNHSELFLCCFYVGVPFRALL